MPDLVPYEHERQVPKWPIVIIGISCLILVLWLKLPGLIISAAILAAVFGASQLRPVSSEVTSLLTSIRLSADEILDIQEEWDNYLDGTSADALADRTLHRPALADPDCHDPDIQKFHFTMANARRFLSRLDARLEADLSVPQLEGILKVTDARALDLRESWLIARQAAHRLGPGYDSDPPQSPTA